MHVRNARSATCEVGRDPRNDTSIRQRRCRVTASETRFFVSAKAEVPVFFSVGIPDPALITDRPLPLVGHSHDENTWPSPPRRSFLRLEADVPNRSQRMFVQMSEQTRGLEFLRFPAGETMNAES